MLKFIFNKDLLPKCNVHVGLSVEVGLVSRCGIVVVAQLLSCVQLFEIP